MTDLTIVIPAFRAEKTIGRTLASLAAQTDRHFRIEIVLDGPDTKLFKTLLPFVTGKAFGDEFGELCHVNSLPENKGPGYARNSVLQELDSGFVLFLDADDVLTPYAIADIRKAMADSPDLIDGGFLKMQYDGSYAHHCLDHNTWVHGRAYNVKFLKQYGIHFPALRLCEDLTFNLLVKEFMNTYSRCYFPIAIQTWNSGSLSHSNGAQEREAVAYIQAGTAFAALASAFKPYEDMEELPQVIAMNYKYADAFPDTEAPSAFVSFCRMIRLPKLMNDKMFSDRVMEYVNVPARPYGGPARPRSRTFKSYLKELEEKSEGG